MMDSPLTRRCALRAAFGSLLALATAAVPPAAAHHWGNHGHQRPGKIWTRCGYGGFWWLLVVEYDRIGHTPDGGYLWQERRRFLGNPRVKARLRKCDGINAYPPGEVVGPKATPETGAIGR